MNMVATTAGRKTGPRRWYRRAWHHLQQLAPPFHSRHFWMIQVLVLAIVALHGIVETSDLLEKWGVPFILPNAFFLIPVVYAALTFGLSAALVTAFWATIVSIPDVTVWHRGAEQWAELLQLVIVIIVAFFVGREVDRVKQARLQAETAALELQASRIRYRSLFESSPAVILVLDPLGNILEANPASATLFNVDKKTLESTTLARLLGAANARNIMRRSLEEGKHPEPLTINLATGQELYLETMTRDLADGQGNLITEVLLRDVTREHGVQTGQRAYTAYMTRVQEEERQRIARDLHDQTIQSMMLLCRRLDNINEEPALPVSIQRDAREAKATAEDIVKGLRDFTRALRPPSLDDLGLVISIRGLLDEFSDRLGVRGDFKATGREKRLPSDTELGLYRIAQEALWNVEHHARASRITIAIAYSENEVRLEVTDDGTGFTMTSYPGDLMATGHLGLISMQERANLMAGTLTIRTGPGKGTSVIVTVPLAGPGPGDRTAAAG
jgi:PAS domain S-box-containing protein